MPCSYIVARAVRGKLCKLVYCVRGKPELVEAVSSCVPDIETFAVGGQPALIAPAEVTLQLVSGVMTRSLDQRLGQTERERGIVGPVPGSQIEHPAAYHPTDLRKGASMLELGSRPDSIAARKSDEGPTRAVHAVG